MADNKVPGEDIPHHHRETDPIRLLHVSGDSKSSDVNQQEMIRTRMPKVWKRNQKVPDIMEQPLLDQPPEQPKEQPPEQPKEQPPEGNGSIENVEQNDDIQKQENLSAFRKHLIVFEAKHCCYCFTRKCPNYCSCCPRWCPTFKIFPDTDTINDARQIGTFALWKCLFFNLLWPVLREALVYGGLGVTFGLFCINLVMLVCNLHKDERQIRKTLRYIKIGFSTFGLLFTIFDAGLHFRHYGFRLAKRCRAFRRDHTELDLDLDNVKPGETKYEFCNENLACNNIFGKRFAACMDVVRIFVLETVFYPNLLISVFEFIMELVDNDYNPSMISWTTWLSSVASFLASLFLVYVHRVFVFAKVIYLIGKQIKEYSCQGILFLVIFLIHMYMMLFLQILMIVVIGSQFYHNYVNDRAIEMSWQLWYMMISAYLMPLLGIFMFFVVHHFWTMKLPVDVVYNLLCKFQAKGEKEYKDEDTQLEEFKELSEYLGGEKFKDDYQNLNEVSFWRKFIYPYISPFHIIVIVFYNLFLGCFAFCSLYGPLAWFWFYVATGAFALVLNIYSASVAFVWLLIVFLALVAVIVIIGIFVIILLLLIIGAPYYGPVVIILACGAWILHCCCGCWQ